MKAIALAVLLLPSLAFSQNLAEGEKAFDFPEFRECGLVTRYASTKISPACLTEALNVIYDEDLAVSRRDGYSQYTSAPCGAAKAVKGMWPFNAVDGQRYLVMHSSQTMYYTKGDGSCIAIDGLSNLNATAEIECVQSQGAIWCTNGIDTPFYWNGTSTGTFGYSNVAATQYYGTKIGTFRSRIILADINDSKTRFRLSGEGDGTDWDIKIPGHSTSPASVDISGLNDGDAVTCLMGQYQDAYLIGRKKDLYALYGTDRRNFELRKISNEVGCVDQRSVREKNNCLVWLSERGVEKYCGTTIQRVSDGIRPTILEIISSFGNSRSKTYNSQADWEAGVYQTQLPQEGLTSTTIFPGSIVTSTFGHTNDNAEWNDGNLVQIDSVTTNGSIQLAYNGAASVLDQFTDNNYTSNPTWTCSGNCGLISFSDPSYVSWLALDPPSGTAATVELYTPVVTKHYGSWSIKTGQIYTGSFQYVFISTQPSISNVSGYALYGTVTWDGAGTPGTLYLYRLDNGTPTTLASVAYTGGVHTYNIDRNSSGGISVRDGATVVLTSTDTTHTFDSSYVNVRLTGTGYAGGIAPSAVDNIYIPAAFYSSGTWTSGVYDTAFTTSVGGPYNFSDTVPVGSTVIYSVAQSADGSAFDAWVNVSTTTSGAYRIPFYKRYYKEKIVLSTSYSTQTPSVELTSLSATNTGYYIADCIDATGITSWGNFRPSYAAPYANSIAFAVSTGATCNAATRSTNTWTAQTPNVKVAVSTAPYLGVRTFLNPTSSTDTLRLDSLTDEWNEGSNRPPVASVVQADRYLMFYTTETASNVYNKNVLVLDSNDKWSLFDNINAYSAALYDGDIFIGNSQGNGHVYQFVPGTLADDSGNFTFRVKTSDVDMGNPVEQKLLKRIYLMLESDTSPAQDIQMSVNYYIDGSTTPYSMGDVQLTEAPEAGYFVAKFPVSTTLPATFHWISFSVEYTGNQGPLSLYGIKVVYRPLDWD